jgi:GR25 family glycosyltransferase involved in LPS biosynthesis
MMFNRSKLAVLFFCLPLFLTSFRFPDTGTISKAAFANKFLDLARMVHDQHGIPVSVILAQSMHESGLGNSELVLQANNYFGMKCKLEGELGYYKKDDEPQKSCFRTYTSAEESFKDYGARIGTHAIYKNAQLLNEAGVTDYRKWVQAIADAGYAKNPKYAETLIALIEQNELYAYDGVVAPSVQNSLSLAIDELVSEELSNELTEAISEFLSEHHAVALPKPAVAELPVTYEMPAPQSTYSNEPDQSGEVKIYSTPASTHPLNIRSARWFVPNTDIR